MTSMIARDVRKIYFEQFIFMAALLIPAVYLNGMRSLAVCGVSIAACILTDWICCLLRKQPYDFKDSSVLFWGLCTALLMPSSMPYIYVGIAGIICIAIGKHVFGGTDNIIFSPPAIAAAFMIICYPSEMLYFPKPGTIFPMLVDDYNGTLVRSLEYTLRIGNTPTESWLDILLGSTAGSIGTVHILVVLVCGICLMAKRSTSFGAVISAMITIAVLAFFYPRIEVGGIESILYEFSSGYMLFGVMFMASDPAILPKHLTARVMYGIVLGYTVMMFRAFGQVEGSFMFALLITNALGCCLDTFVDNLSYWRKTYLNSYEPSKTDALKGNIKLTDTQEIQIPEKYRYNTPPIDGVIKKSRRRKTKGGDRNGRK